MLTIDHIFSTYYHCVRPKSCTMVEEAYLQNLQSFDAFYYVKKLDSHSSVFVFHIFIKQLHFLAEWSIK
jgi:hypothetical protein